ncbi:MAG: 3-oxoacyl-ACP reductase FabG [Gammaproteobacteria bacterium]|jgi:3-oxoacyl-[acyl-carrier protein] reductase|nr:3-oxoacyl-ACP reductase FabG [Gammaproteobacteria bacterium]
MDKKIAWVTGATRGIGAAIANVLVSNGFYVIGTATRQEGADEISQRLGEKGAGFVLNISDPESINLFLKAMQATEKMPSVLVNNAGIAKDNLLMRMSDDDWLAVINTNLNSVFRLTKACMRTMMKAEWGRIISIGSIVGVTGNPGQANYCAAKAGVIGFSKSLAQEIGSRNITVNVVAPGFIETDMTQKLKEEYRKILIDRIPLKRIGSPNDIAHMVAFLASDEAGYITGQTLHVNGGMAMI